MRKRLTYRPYWKKQELTGRYASKPTGQAACRGIFLGEMMKDGGVGENRRRRNSPVPRLPSKEERGVGGQF